jgi:transposase
VSVDPRDLRISKLEGEVTELKALLGRALMRIDALEAENRVLRTENADLRARLDQNSNNSSKPPSSDGPAVKREQKKPPTGRKPGGQPGHEKSSRELLPVEKVDHVMPLVPDRCGHCSSRRVKQTRDEPRRHQQVELPRPKAEVTEYQCHAVGCLDCGAITVAELPPAAVPVFGERLSALACALMGQYRLSKRNAQRLFADVLGVELSLGMLPKLGAEMGEALATPTAEAVAYVREATIANADESGWYEGKKDGRARRAWIWTFATSLVVVFRIAFSRGGDVAKDVLGENFNAFLGTDRWGGYNWYDLALRQICWSHLTRDFQGFIDRGGVGGRLGRELMLERNRMFRWWHCVRDGTLARAVFEMRMGPVRRRVARLLGEASVRAESKTAGMAVEMLKVEEAFWTFVDVEGVEPTNNFAERCIRHAVMLRKTSFGTQSSDGSRFVERVLTALTSLNLQKRNVLDFLTLALRAHRTGGCAPSLLPQQAAPLALAA